MAQSRRQVRPRSSRLVHSASFCARNPNKASMTLMLAATSICATDALERHLAPPGFQCCERHLLGRSKLQDSAMRRFHQKKCFLHRCKDFCTLDALGSLSRPRLKIQPPGTGEQTRRVTPHFCGSGVLRLAPSKGSGVLRSPKKAFLGSKLAHGPISTPSPSQKLSFSPFCIILRKESE